MGDNTSETGSISNTFTRGGQTSRVEWSPRWEVAYTEWIATQSDLESGSEASLGHGRQTYRNILDFDPPNLPAWLAHIPELDGTTTPILVFAKTPPCPGDQLALRFLWEPEYVVMTAVVMLPIRRVPRSVLLRVWMGAAMRDCLFVDIQGDRSCSILEDPLTLSGMGIPQPALNNPAK